MKRICVTLAVSLLMLTLVRTAYADQAVLYEYDGSFEDAVFDTRDAIISQGLNIDYVSHVGEMLFRTKEDVGGKKDIFKNAEIYVFCSAALSRRAMEADPFNIVHCPYNVFVVEMTGETGKVYVGHRNYPDGDMQIIEDLLIKIANEATGN